MRTLSNECIISSPAHSVWRVLMDFKSYPSWNPLISRIVGKPQNGSRGLLFIQAMGPLPLVVPIRFLNVESEKELRWEGKVPGLSKLGSGVHFFEIEKISSDQTRLIHGETFSGWLVNPLWKVLEPHVRENYRKCDLAIKRRCESLSHP